MVDVDCPVWRASSVHPRAHLAHVANAQEPGASPITRDMMGFGTKIVVVVRGDLENGQRLNVTAFWRAGSRRALRRRRRHPLPAAVPAVGARHGGRQERRWRPASGGPTWGADRGVHQRHVLDRARREPGRRRGRPRRRPRPGGRGGPRTPATPSTRSSRARRCTRDRLLITASGIPNGGPDARPARRAQATVTSTSWRRRRGGSPRRGRGPRAGRSRRPRARC